MTNSRKDKVSSNKAQSKAPKSTLQNKAQSKERNSPKPAPSIKAKKAPKDNSATRVLLIIRALINGKDMDTLSQKDFDFDISKRTFQRDIKRVRDFFAEHFMSLHAVAKYIQKFAHLSGIKALYPSLDEYFLNELLDDKTNFIYNVKPNTFESIDDERFERLSNAILSKKILKFTYKNKAREVKPYTLSHIQGIWYLIADENGTLKHFAFNKLKALKFTEQKFRPKAEFTTQIKAQQNLWLTASPKSATLIISSQAKEYFLRKSLPKNFHIIKNDENALFVRMFYAFEDELFKLVKTWLPYVSVQEKALQEKFNEMLKNYLKNNDKTQRAPKND